jgi:hypothetical protein
MIEDRGGGPPISIKATRTIFNPWYTLPAHVTVIGPDAVSKRNDGLEITSPCRIELREHKLRLFFQNNEVIFVFTDNSLASRYLVNPIRDFLIYQTFINYNAIGPAINLSDESTFKEVDRIQFKVERIIRVELERQEGDKVIKGFYHTGHQDEFLEIVVDNIAQYLRVLNPALYYAQAFYLIGCDNPRYFLIEFYKAVESVSNVFKGEDDFLKSLKPYGVMKGKFKEFAKVCNDMRLAPLDIGRHAPMPNAQLYSVDLRDLLIEPRSREVLELSTVFCRQVIDAYRAYLTQ